MATKDDLSAWIVEALREAGGRAQLIDVARYIWEEYEDELRASGDLFYTWQYDMRWQAQKLRNEGVLLPDSKTSQGTWALND